MAEPAAFVEGSASEEDEEYGDSDHSGTENGDDDEEDIDPADAGRARMDFRLTESEIAPMDWSTVIIRKRRTLRWQTEDPNQKRL